MVPLGIALSGISTALEELSTSIGKAQVARHAETIYSLGFLNLLWGTVAFLQIALQVADPIGQEVFGYYFRTNFSDLCF